MSTELGEGQIIGLAIIRFSLEVARLQHMSEVADDPPVVAVSALSVRVVPKLSMQGIQAEKLTCFDDLHG